MHDGVMADEQDEYEESGRGVWLVWDGSIGLITRPAMIMVCLILCMKHP